MGGMIERLAVEVRDLSKTYRSGIVRRRRVEALRGVSLQIGRGEIFGLLGPNGAGKTTLIKILLGIVRPTAGGGTLLGRPVGDRRCRRRVGYLPENHRFPQHLTGNTALEYFGGLSGMSRRDIRNKTPRLLDLVGLASWGRTPVRQYSKGMQQRLGLAQAMLHDPDLLVLDEPTDGVDPVGRKDMRVILQQLKREGRTIFINSHLLQEVELVCDRVAILNHGQVSREGHIDELTTGPTSEIAFTLLADETTVRAALDGANTQGADIQGADIQRIVASVAGPLVVTLGAADQAAVDRCVDRLRGAGVSIVAISGQRRTLEDAFLEIVASAPHDGRATVASQRADHVPGGSPGSNSVDAEILP
jgi:ABC-2 type transport system ATP-binding protein